MFSGNTCASLMFIKVEAETPDNRFLDYRSLFTFDLTKKACLRDFPAIEAALKSAWCAKKFTGPG